jgi:putative tryptophan/tyrosine transport system substrate-binding protein
MTTSLEKFVCKTLQRRNRPKKTLAQKLIFLALTVLLAFPNPSRSQTTCPAVVGVLYGPQTSYRAAVQALQKMLETRGRKCLLVELPKPDPKAKGNPVLDALAAAKPQAIVAVGLPAVTLLRQSDPKVPVVFSMIPNVLDTSFWNEKNKARTTLPGVTTDIDPKEQIEWTKLTDPELKNIGVFYSPRTLKTAQAIQKAGKAAGIAVTLIQTDLEKISDGLKQLNQMECDAVLMLPDAGIYNSTTVRALLLWGIRQKKTVFGFSENIVKAGGFAGQYCKAEDVGKQTAELVEELLKGKKPDKIGLQYAGSIRKAINLRTAQMIGKPFDENLFDKKVVRFGNDQ